MIRGSRCLILVGLALVFSGRVQGQSSLSTSPQGSIHGTIKAVEAGKKAAAPLRSASLDLIVRRNNEDVVLSSGATDNNGHFRIRSGAFPERPYLDVDAVGYAPNRFALKKLANGEGLLLPDIYLDRGVSVGATVEAGLTEEAPVWMHVFPLTESQRIIDIDGKPLLKARFDSAGRLQLPHVAEGLYAFVVTDYGSRFIPALQVWRVGRDDVVLPHFHLSAGSDLTLTMKSKAQATVEGELLTGFGRWHPGGGVEYRMRQRLSCVASDEGLATIKVSHLPPSVCDVRLFTASQVTDGRFLPGTAPVAMAWRPAATVSGQVAIPLPNAPWDKATVMVGGRAAKLGSRGQFECAGLPAGSHKVFLHIPGFPALTNRRVVLKSGEERRNFHLTPEIGSQLIGETRNTDLKRTPYVWVGCDLNDSNPRFLGRYFQGVSESDGSYAIKGLVAGIYQVYVQPPSDGISENETVELKKSITASVPLRFVKGGSGGGTLLDADRKPVPFARVQLIEQPAPLSFVLGGRRQPRLTSPVLHQTVTDKNGRYQFRGLRPGRHSLVFEPPEQAPQIAADINISEGVNRSGFDWQLEPINATLVDLPFATPYVVRSLSHGLIERWLYRPTGSPACRITALPAGSYELVPLPIHLLHARFVDEKPNYIEWRKGSLSTRVTVPSDAVAKVRPFPELRLATHTVRLRIGDEFPPDGEKVELTAFPLAGACPMEPVRLGYLANPSEFEINLPQGIWFLRASSPNRGTGSTGPFSLGRGFEEENPKPLTLNVEAPAVAIGFVDLVKQESEQGEGVYVSSVENLQELIHPWRVLAPRVPLSETGDLRFEQLPAGSSIVRVFGPQALLDVPVESDSFELNDLRRLTPGLPAALNLDFSPAAFLDNTWTSRMGRQPIRRQATLLPGTFLFDCHLPWSEIESGGVWSLRQPLELESGDVLLGPSDLSPRGRASLRGTLRVDGVNLSHCAIELVPVLGDAHDTSRAILKGQTDRQGAFRFTRVVAGEYAFVFTYTDEDNRPYQMALPLFLPDRNTTVSENVRIRTRALTALTFDLGDGAPGEGALIRILRTDLRGLGTSTVFRGRIEEIARGIADDNGEVTFRSLPLGTYDIEISRRGRVTEILKGVDLAVGSGALALRSAATTGFGANIEILDQDELPVPGAECFLFTKEGVRVLSDVLLLTDANGMLFVDDLDPQTYRLFVKAPGFPSQQLGDVEVRAQDRKVQTRSAESGANLVVRCVDDDGNQIQGVKVFVESEEGFWEHFGPRATLLDERRNDVNRYGALQLRNVPQGDCRLRATHAGFHTFTGTTKIRASVRNQFELILKRKE